MEKRCRSSLNGVTVIIVSDTGKCDHHQVLLKTCKSSASWKCRKESEQDLHDQILSIHQCLLIKVVQQGQWKHQQFLSASKDHKIRNTYDILSTLMMMIPKQWSCKKLPLSWCQSYKSSVCWSHTKLKNVRERVREVVRET